MAADEQLSMAHLGDEHRVYPAQAHEEFLWDCCMRVESKAGLDILSITVGRTRNREMLKFLILRQIGQVN